MLKAEGVYLWNAVSIQRKIIVVKGNTNFGLLISSESFGIFLSYLFYNIYTSLELPLYFISYYS